MVGYQKFLEEASKYGRDGAASILMELAQQERITNSKYLLAYNAVKQILGNDMPAYMDAWFVEIMTDENDHDAKFAIMSSEISKIPVGTVKD